MSKVERFPCWSCKESVSMRQRANADGDCPHCGVELDLEDWPAKQVASTHPLIKCLNDNGDLIAAQATIAQQAQMIEHLRGGPTPLYTAVDVTNADVRGRRSLAEYITEQMALKQYPEDRADAECAAYNSALNDVREMLRSVNDE